MRWINAYSRTWRTNLTMSIEGDPKDILIEFNKKERMKNRISDWEYIDG